MPHKTASWADRVSALVEKHGSPEAVAAAVGVSSMSVQRWRAGSHQPSHLAQKRIIELENRKDTK